jgi:hypothetical protein
MSYSSADLSLLLSQIQNNQHDTGYQLQLLNSFQHLSDTVKKQNDMIYSTYYNKIIFNSADGQKGKYINQSSDILKNIFTYGFWVYMFFAIILCAVVFRKEMHIIFKILLIIAIITYPFYIYPLEELTYVISTYIWNLLISVAYNTGYGNLNLEYGMTKGSSGEDTINKIKDTKDDEEEDKEDEDANVPPQFVLPSAPEPPTSPPLADLNLDTSEADELENPPPSNVGNAPDGVDPSGSM